MFSWPHIVPSFTDFFSKDLYGVGSNIKSDLGVLSDRMHLLGLSLVMRSKVKNTCKTIQKTRSILLKLSKYVNIKGHYELKITKNMGSPFTKKLGGVAG